MRYLVSTIVRIINNNIPDSNNELILKIDGFDNLKIYEAVSKELTKTFNDKKIDFRIVLAPSKWEQLKKSSDTTIVQSMLSNGWVSETESITHFRNLHDKRVLVMLGTEDEDDNGGLKNVFEITPYKLFSELNGKYEQLFPWLEGSLSDYEVNAVRKLYHDLFMLVPADIIKLSDFADRNITDIYSFEELISKFYETLPMWGLPKRSNSLPKLSSLSKKGNVLKSEYDFITRKTFKRLSESQYKKYLKKIEEYREDENSDYNINWNGWTEQPISSYDGFFDCVKDFIYGKNIEINRKKILQADYDIIEDVLGFKLKPSDKKQKKSIINLVGSPIEVMCNAVLTTLSNAKNGDYELVDIIFEFKNASIVCSYSSTENDEEMLNLQGAWSNICYHTNGILEYIGSRGWMLNDEDINFTVEPHGFFLPANAKNNIENGLIEAAGANKKISVISFTVKCKNSEGNYIKTLEQDYFWKINDNVSWLYDLKDLLSIDDKEDSIVPLPTMRNLKSLLFAKSDDEFWDLYDERKIETSYNLVKRFGHVGNDAVDKAHNEFYKLGKKFKDFIKEIKKVGLYGSLMMLPSPVDELISQYVELGKFLVSNSFPENQFDILKAFIHAFTIEENEGIINDEVDLEYCIIPPWHPAALEKVCDQKKFILEGCLEWWNDQLGRDRSMLAEVNRVIEELSQMALIQSAVDIMPSGSESGYFAAVSSFGSFTCYSRDDLENDTRLKDIIRKDAVFDDDFDLSENKNMTDNAKMIYGVINDYAKAFPDNKASMSLVFVDPTDLQPIVASVCKYIQTLNKNYPNIRINMSVKVFVRPNNKGGRNYLSYWMDECFSQDSNIKVKTYLMEWDTNEELLNLLNGNNDIVFAMDLLKARRINFQKDSFRKKLSIDQCRYPIIFKPSPVSRTTNPNTRILELSQPQFSCSYIHTQVVRYFDRHDDIPTTNFMAIKQLRVEKDISELVYALHEKAYWVVCVDSNMDGALLKDNKDHGEKYAVIGFSTGKGIYGKYNLTITARNAMLEIIEKKLQIRLKKLFGWDDEVIAKVANICVTEATKLDGISLLSAINPKDYNINEFMAYVLTSLYENETSSQSALKILIHLDSFKHWFSQDIEETEEKNKKRPDFLIFDVKEVNDRLLINATVTECKISSEKNADEHNKKAVTQVQHGIEVLSTLFNPNSTSIRRRYWFAQLYRALAFAQITFSSETSEYEKMAEKLREILDGEFDIKWSGKVLGYWYDMEGEEVIATPSEDYSNIDFITVPQKKIVSLFQKKNIAEVSFSDVPSEVMTDEQYVEYTNERTEKNDYELDNLTAMTEVDSIQVQTADIIEDNKEASNNNAMEIRQNKVDEIEDADKKNDSVESIVTDETVSSENKLNTETCQIVVSNSVDDIRVKIGKCRSGEDIYWEFGNQGLSNRHLLITGASGQGKTYSIQAMLYELSKNNISSVIIDYTEGFRKNQLETDFVNKMGNRINQLLVKYQKVPINPFKRQFVDVDGDLYPDTDADIASRFSDILTHVYHFGEQQSSAIFEATRKGLEKYKDDMNMNHFKEELEKEKDNNKTAQSVLAKMLPFFYSVEFEENSDFDWEKVIYPENPTCTIFQLTGLDRNMQLTIAELLLWDLWYYAMKNGNKDKPFVVILDEAQNLSHKAKSPSCKILTEGRKFGWSAWFATQSLKVLNDDEVIRLMNSGFQLYFKPTDAEVAKISQMICPEDKNSWISSVQTLNKSECVVKGNRRRPNGVFGAAKPVITKISALSDR